MNNKQAQWPLTNPILYHDGQNEGDITHERVLWFTDVTLARSIGPLCRGTRFPFAGFDFFSMYLRLGEHHYIPLALSPVPSIPTHGLDMEFLIEGMDDRIHSDAETLSSHDDDDDDEFDPDYTLDDDSETP